MNGLIAGDVNAAPANVGNQLGFLRRVGLPTGAVRLRPVTHRGVSG